MIAGGSSSCLMLFLVSTSNRMIFAFDTARKKECHDSVEHGKIRHFG
jgi:hypothetical protein